MTFSTNPDPNYVGPDFAVLNPVGNNKVEVWAYKDSRRLGVYSERMAEQVKSVYDTGSLAKHKHYQKKQKGEQTKVSSRLRVGLQALASVIAQALPIVAEVRQMMAQGQETARPNPTKPYKPRRMKLDPIHKMARTLYKMKVRNPAFVKKQKLQQKLYRRKNKLLLERRSEFVKKARDRMGLD